MIDIAIKAAQAAGKILQENFGKITSASYKDPDNVVSEADKASEKKILAILKENFPKHSFFSEETGWQKKESDHLWIIDPLDGTSNFVHGLPHWCVSIALFVKQKPEIGVIFDPIHNELFSAQRNRGAFLNDQKVVPSTIDKLEQTVTLMARGSNPKAKDRHAQLYQVITKHTRTTRVMGSTALSIAYIACGRFDAVVNNDCKFYDCAAGNIIALEAGARITDFAGDPWTGENNETTDILAANQHIHADILTILK